MMKFKLQRSRGVVLVDLGERIHQQSFDASLFQCLSGWTASIRQRLFAEHDVIFVASQPSAGIAGASFLPIKKKPIITTSTITIVAPTITRRELSASVLAFFRALSP
jgi:hypothetical protein